MLKRAFVSTFIAIAVATGGVAATAGTASAHGIHYKHYKHTKWSKSRYWKHHRHNKWGWYGKRHEHGSKIVIVVR